MFPMRVGKCNVFVAPSGRKVMGTAFPNAARPYGRLHWATIVAHSVRWPLPRPTLNYPLGEHNDKKLRKVDILAHTRFRSFCMKIC